MTFFTVKFSLDNLFMSTAIFLNSKLKSQPLELMRAVLLLSVGVILLTVSAKFKVPIDYHVPITLQTLVVLAIGLGYGLGLGVATVVSYLALGAMGAPVFADGGGLLYFTIKGTAGYLYGFVVAAAFCGWAVKKGFDHHWLSIFLVLLIADALIFLCGVSFLALVINLGWSKAATVGLAPFIIGDLCKVGLVTLLAYAAKKAIDKKSSSSNQ